MATKGGVGAAQTTPARGDVDANANEHVRLARLAAEHDVRLLVFPELSLTGYELDLAEDLAFTPDDSRLAELRREAANLQMTLVVGAPVDLGGRLHIGALALDPAGSVEVYTKQRLGAFPANVGIGGVVPPREDSVFEPGDRNPLVRTGHGKAAMAICADIGRSAHPEAARDRGADLYLASTFIIPVDFEQDSQKLRDYAFRFGMIVVLSNFGGASGGLPSAGRSGVWSKAGALLARLESSGSGIAYASETAEGWHGAAATLDQVPLSGRAT